MPTLVEELVQFAYEIKYGDLPPEVVSESKRLLLDSIGCGIAALSTDKGRIAVAFAQRGGGKAEAGIYGVTGRVSTSAAAFANGELINTLDYDALISPPGHVSPYVIPAILAVAEANRNDGRDIIRAIAVAHEISARLGRAMSDVRSVAPGEKITFPAISGYSSTIFGGSLGTAMLSGLTKEQAGSALGLAGHIAPVQSMGKWVRTMPATTEKYVMGGWLSQAQLLAVDLAQAGYRGDVGVLDGDFGFWRFVGSGRWMPEALTNELGGQWSFPQSAIYKPYPHCRISQTVLDCLNQLIDEHGLVPDEIERVDAYCDPHAALQPMWSSHNIVSCLDAQMSVPFAVSLVVHRVGASPAWQSEEVMRNPQHLAFMEKVHVHAHPDFEEVIRQEPGSRIGKVDVRARGQLFSAERKYRKGSPATAETRMGDAELVRKFSDNCAAFLTPTQIDALVEGLMSLETVPDFLPLSENWQGSPH